MLINFRRVEKVQKKSSQSRVNGKKFELTRTRTRNSNSTWLKTRLSLAGHFGFLCLLRFGNSQNSNTPLRYTTGALHYSALRGKNSTRIWTRMHQKRSRFEKKFLGRDAAPPKPLLHSGGGLPLPTPHPLYPQPHSCTYVRSRAVQSNSSNTSTQLQIGVE